MLKKIIASTLAVSALPFMMITAAEASNDRDNVMLAAKKVVLEYKELRNACAHSEGEDRRSCMSSLYAASEEYSEAKKLLRELELNKEQNVHFVTFL